MKKNKLLLVLAFAIMASAAFAQKGVSIGVASHLINVTPDSYFPSKYWQIGAAKLSLGIPLSDQLTLSPAFAFGKAKTVAAEKNSYWDLDASLQYALTTTKFQPYVTIGAGANNFEKKTYGTFNGGLGINYWIAEKFALTAQTTYDATPKFQDYFHNSIGFTFKLKGGPKDSDKDGIPDDRDACPTVKGVASANGCPDADGDGVKDSDDACVNEVGTTATNGCPDSDGDGIANAQDACPTVAGKADLKGCPDTDSDGIADKDDACPTEKGTAQFNGCPDTDGDGIADKNDKCPTVKGNAANQGCPDPDGDNDGISDALDKCPTQAGTAANNGCPEIKAEEAKQIEEKLNLAAKLIQFETSKAVIRPVSFKEIDAIVAIMNQYAWTRFRIEGHTDNIGDAGKNQALSDARSKAVKDYIVSKGINGSRLDAAGFGSTKPLATNATVEGRTQNRRVEIHLAQ